MSKVDPATGPRNPSAEKRRYDSPRRAEQAASTRRSVVAAAAECFAEAGYARTTMGRIAERAGVSVETVNLNGPKRNLLIAAFSQTLVGEETDDPLELGAWQGVLAITDRDEFVARVADLVLEGQQVGMGLWRALEAAAIEEPDVAELYAGLSARRRRDCLTGARLLADRGWIIEGRSVEDVADTIALLNGFDPYQLFVREFGWPVEKLRGWYVDMLERTVMTPSP
ncbi:MAG: hypothetical protein QOC59_255 [Microbacteriaceae bacterium]|nr:hypothetical protein [Microbacteriaceae bacterium]